MTLLVSEMFGPTWQGEGPSAGRRAWFLRLGGCNLRCSWCDTPWTWDASRYDLRAENRRLGIEEVLVWLRMIRDHELLVITGGEPLLQAEHLGALIPRLPPVSVEVETNGTLKPPWWSGRVRFNVSPKLASSGNASELHPAWREDRTAVFKFVVIDLDDLAEVAGLALPPSQVWIMPEGTDSDVILETARELADAVLDLGYHLTLRQQVLLWGNERRR